MLFLSSQSGLMLPFDRRNRLPEINDIKINVKAYLHYSWTNTGYMITFNIQMYGFIIQNSFDK